MRFIKKKIKIGEMSYICGYSYWSLSLLLFLFFVVSGKVGNWTHTFSLWCMNPAVVFRDIADLSLSVVLTSG